MSQYCDTVGYTLKSSLQRKIFEKLALFYICLEKCVGDTIISWNIPKSSDYMPKMPNKVGTVDPEGDAWRAYLPPCLYVGLQLTSYTIGYTVYRLYYMVKWPTVELYYT